MGGPGGFSEYSQVPKDFISSLCREWIALFGMAKHRPEDPRLLFKSFQIIQAVSSLTSLHCLHCLHCLHTAGFVFVGHCPKDEAGGALGSTSGSAAIMANRISFCMGSPLRSGSRIRDVPVIDLTEFCTWLQSWKCMVRSERLDGLTLSLALSCFDRMSFTVYQKSLNLH